MPAPIAPPLGQVAPGELYVDLQTRTLWLGVSASVDPNQAVLISNIENADDLAAETLAAANANTAAAVATRAPTVHTHLAADITNFNAAVDARITASPSAAQFSRGMIMMYSGLLNAIGVGPLAGWALCDGSLGTPNLRDKFVIGAGNKLPGVISPADPLLISGGSHVHTINGTALALAELPVHNHGGSTGVEVVKHTHPISIVTDEKGSHQHTGLNVNASGSDSAEAGPLISVNAAGSGPIGIQSSPLSTTALGGLHTHNVIGNTGVGVDHVHTIPDAGSGQTHTHTIVGGGGIHEHSVAQAALREAMPYVALAYIMKL